VNAIAKPRPPISNRDFDFFYRGLSERRLLVQKCWECGRLRNPPSPMCAACRSLAIEYVECKGEGTVYSYTVHHHPALPGFSTPHSIVLVELDEGVRMIGAIAELGDPASVIGARVSIEWTRSDDVDSFRFVRNV
jgi:uncharacterized OB-fold protein